MFNDLIIKKGDMFSAVFDAVGSEQGGLRPFVVVQNNLGNKYSPTLIVALITTKVKRQMPTHVLANKEFGLKEDSIIMLEQIRTIDKSRIIPDSYIGRLNRETIKKVDEAMSISVALDTQRDLEIRKQLQEVEYWKRNIDELLDDVYSSLEQIKQRVLKLKLEYCKFIDTCKKNRVYHGDYFILDEFKYESILRSKELNKAKVL